MDEVVPYSLALKASHSHAAQILKISCSYLEELLRIQLETEANLSELSAAWKRGITFLREQAEEEAAQG